MGTESGRSRKSATPPKILNPLFSKFGIRNMAENAGMNFLTPTPYSTPYTLGGLSAILVPFVREIFNITPLYRRWYLAIFDVSVLTCFWCFSHIHMQIRLTSESIFSTVSDMFEYSQKSFNWRWTDNFWRVGFEHFAPKMATFRNFQTPISRNRK